MKPLHMIDHTADLIEKGAQAVVAFLLGVMVLAVLAGVLTRNIRFSVTWLEEISRYCQVWFVSLGIGLSLRRGELAGTELLVKALPRKLRKIVLVGTKFLMLGFSVIMLHYGNQLIGHLISTNQLSPNMRIPMYYAYAGIYAGFILILIFLLVSLLHNFVSQDDALDKNLLVIAPVISTQEYENAEKEL